MKMHNDADTISWNVVATTQPDAFTRARQLLERFGTVATTGLYNVIVMQVDDPAAFPQAFEKRSAEDSRLLRSIARIVPFQQTFTFSTRAEFETRVKEAVLRLAGQLEGRTFHVRVKLRGQTADMPARTECTALQTALLDELTRRGKPGRICFDHPDAVVDVETVGCRAGVSLWSRSDLDRFPFLKVD